MTSFQTYLLGFIIVVVGLAAGVIGAGLSPLFVGRVSDWLIPTFGDQSIRYALIGPIVSALLAGAAAMLGARHVRADYASLKAAS